jgi:hypothetical protein
LSYRRGIEHVPARLIGRRVKRLNPDNVPTGQTAEYRHAVFTDSPLSMPAAESAASPFGPHPPRSARS